MPRLILVTARDIISQKLFYAIALVALLLLGIGVVFSTGALYDPKRFVYDAGSASMEIFGCLTAILFGASLIPKEIERGSLFIVLSKPISRPKFLAAKFFGLLSVGTLLVFGLLIPFGLIYSLIYQGTIDAPFLLDALIDIGKLSVLGSLAFTLGIFSTPTLATMLTTFTWLVATSLDTAMGSLKFIEVGWVRGLIPILYRTLPNFSVVSAETGRIPILGVPCPVWLLSLAYLALWSAFFVILAGIVFQRRNLVR